MKAWAGRLGAMLLHPVSTLDAVVAGRRGDVADAVWLALLTVLAIYPASVARYLWLVEVDVTMAISKLLAGNGFVWSRLRNPAAYCGASAACFFVFSRAVLHRKVTVWDCLSAGAYLYVPVAALSVAGLLLHHAGVALPWLPHHPVDGWWVLEGNRVHLDRFYLKLVVAFAWPTVVGLAWAAWAWRQIRGTRPPHAATGAEPATPPPSGPPPAGGA